MKNDIQTDLNKNDSKIYLQVIDKINNINNIVNKKTIDETIIFFNYIESFINWVNSQKLRKILLTETKKLRTIVIQNKNLYQSIINRLEDVLVNWNYETLKEYKNIFNSIEKDINKLLVLRTRQMLQIQLKNVKKIVINDYALKLNSRLCQEIEFKSIEEISIFYDSIDSEIEELENNEVKKLFISFSKNKRIMSMNSLEFDDFIGRLDDFINLPLFNSK